MLAYALGLLLVVGALWILAMATGWGVPYILLAQGLEWLKGNPWESIMVAALLLSLGLLLFVRPRESADHAIKTSSGGGGDVLISMDALQEIIARSAIALKGVLQIQSILRERETGLQITVVCQLEQGVLIPQISADLQEKVKQDVELYTGITVTEVRVLVRRLEKARSAGRVR